MRDMTNLEIVSRSDTKRHETSHHLSHKSEMMIFFCDTYALVEMVLGSPNYAKYLNCILVTGEQNLMELYYKFLRDYDQQKAEKYFEFWTDFLVQIPRETIKNAMTFKLVNKKDNLSYTDCIGYIFSQENEMRFLTGDQKFETKPGVEFVK